MSYLFKQFKDFLSADLLKTLQDDYMRDDIKWTHRNFGRFFCYLENDVHERVLDELYNNENLPVFHNNKMMRHHHMYLQRFVPGSWLPLHREKCYGVLTIYLNPDEDWSEENPAPKFVYYETQDLHDLENNKLTYDIHCNSGTFYLTGDSSNAPEYNAYHKVEYNESNNSRYALQMFFGPSELSSHSMTGDSNFKEQKYRNFSDADKYGDTTVNQTTRAIMSGALELPELGQMAQTSIEWAKDNPGIIERLERDG